MQIHMSYQLRFTDEQVITLQTLECLFHVFNLEERLLLYLEGEMLQKSLRRFLVSDIIPNL